VTKGFVIGIKKTFSFYNLHFKFFYISHAYIVKKFEPNDYKNIIN
jgi:hypothetical protein